MGRERKREEQNESHVSQESVMSVGDLCRHKSCRGTRLERSASLKAREQGAGRYIGIFITFIIFLVLAEFADTEHVKACWMLPTLGSNSKYKFSFLKCAFCTFTVPCVTLVVTFREAEARVHYYSIDFLCHFI